MEAKKTTSKEASSFVSAMEKGYAFSKLLVLGAAMINGKPQKGLLISACLETLNRHGLIAGAKGTGKTRDHSEVS